MNQTVITPPLLAATWELQMHFDLLIQRAAQRERD